MQDGITREEKLEFLTNAGSINGITDWQEITPDESHDWIGKRDQRFTSLLPMGTKEAKFGNGRDVFQTYSRGVLTGRDAYLYNFDRNACAENTKRAVDCYKSALKEWQFQLAARNSFDDCKDKITKANEMHLRWDRELLTCLKRCKELEFNSRLLNRVHYRPFVQVNCYLEYNLISQKYLQDRIFPLDGRENMAICVTGIGSTKPFSVLATNSLPDVQLISNGQCFPRWTYLKVPDQTDRCRSSGLGLPENNNRKDNITDGALNSFQTKYCDETISKDLIFAYSYGILHAPDYLERFKNNFANELPRIPFADDFEAFAEAGQRLLDLHLHFREGPEWPLEVEKSEGVSEIDLFNITDKRMKFIDKARTALQVNDHLVLRGIPPEAHQYEVNGRTPLEWFIDRYRITAPSGILNDPNKWFEKPSDLLKAFQRIVYLSVETVKVVNGLPPSLVD